MVAPLGPFTWLDRFAGTQAGHAMHWAYSLVTQALLAVLLLAAVGALVYELVRIALKVDGKRGDGDAG